MKAISVTATNRSAIVRIILISPSLRLDETDDRSRAKFLWLYCPDWYRSVSLWLREEIQAALRRGGGGLNLHPGELGSKFGSNHAYSCPLMPTGNVRKSLKPLIFGA
jgi:hypothetical protein